MQLENLKEVMMAWSQIKGYFFWLAVIVGAVPMTPIPMFLLGVNKGLGWNFPTWVILAIFFLYHNLYVAAWIFCLDDGLKLKFLLKWRLKLIERKNKIFFWSPFRDALLRVHRARRGAIPKWLTYSFTLGFILAAFVPGIFKVANIYCAIRRRPAELIVWAIITQIRIFFIFYGSSFLIQLLLNLLKIIIN